MVETETFHSFQCYVAQPLVILGNNWECWVWLQHLLTTGAAVNRRWMVPGGNHYVNQLMDAEQGEYFRALHWQRLQRL